VGLVAVRLAVPAETRPGETRVALTPDAAKRLVASGWDVVIQSGAGAKASFADSAYVGAGASVAPDATAVHWEADVVARVQAPTAAEARLVPEGAIVLSFLQPAETTEALAVLAERGASVFSFDFLPRISRAQPMDALSSQSTVSGYRAALLAAEELDRFFPMFMTAAGTVPRAKVLVMGVGVAGLQAIATARRLGAVVRAYDVRAAAKEEAESLGASFVELGVLAEGAGGYARELSEEELARQRQALAAEVAASDVVITTAAVPGRRAPILVSATMVEGMGPGSVIVDMAADSGGNCELTVAGESVVRGGTTIVGLANPAAGMPTHASFLYSRNVANLLALLWTAPAPAGDGNGDGSFGPDWSDEIVIGTAVLRDGVPVHGLTAELLGRPLAPVATDDGP